jgi:hypothetical protein
MPAPVNLVPADQPTVQVVDDPALRGDVEAAISLHGHRSQRGFVSFDMPRIEARFIHIGKDEWGNDHPEFLIDTDRQPPIGLAYDIVLVDRAGREWASDTITFEPGERVGYICNGDWNGFSADRVDVVLKPNASAGAETVGITKIWGGVIRFKDVPVVWDKEARRPTTLPTWGQRRRPATTRAATTTPAATTKSTR